MITLTLGQINLQSLSHKELSRNFETIGNYMNKPKHIPCFFGIFGFHCF